jgi:hypothetical protein
MTTGWLFKKQIGPRLPIVKIYRYNEEQENPAKSDFVFLKETVQKEQSILNRDYKTLLQ